MKTLHLLFVLIINIVFIHSNVLQIVQSYPSNPNTGLYHVMFDIIYFIMYNVFVNL